MTIDNYDKIHPSQRTVWTRSLRTAVVVCHQAEEVHLNDFDGDDDDDDDDVGDDGDNCDEGDDNYEDCYSRK